MIAPGVTDFMSRGTSFGSIVAKIYKRISGTVRKNIVEEEDSARLLRRPRHLGLDKMASGEIRRRRPDPHSQPWTAGGLPRDRGEGLLDRCRQALPVGRQAGVCDRIRPSLHQGERDV